MSNEEPTITITTDSDTEGHAKVSRFIDPAEELVDPDDAEGHRFVPSEERPPVGDTPKAATADDGDDDPEDTDGHKIYARNVGASFDEDPADTGQDPPSSESADTPSSDDDPDDTDGHRVYAKNLGVAFD